MRSTGRRPLPPPRPRRPRRPDPQVRPRVRFGDRGECGKHGIHACRWMQRLRPVCEPLRRRHPVTHGNGDGLPCPAIGIRTHARCGSVLVSSVFEPAVGDQRDARPARTSSRSGSAQPAAAGACSIRRRRLSCRIPRRTLQAPVRGAVRPLGDVRPVWRRSSHKIGRWGRRERRTSGTTCADRS